MVHIESVYEQIRHIAAEEGADRIVLFGSRARGDAFAKSDIDLAVEGCASFERLQDRLENDVWSLLSIDVVNLDTCNSKELRAEIRRDGKVLFEKVR